MIEGTVKISLHDFNELKRFADIGESYDDRRQAINGYNKALEESFKNIQKSLEVIVQKSLEEDHESSWIHDYAKIQLEKSRRIL